MDTRKRNIIIAIMVAMFLAAVEGTVVSIAAPAIARDLEGFELVSWIFSVYFLTSAVTTPIYGKLSDLFGRKTMLSVGIVIFLIGSILCGLSGTMYMLIIFRAIQGLGAGSILTMTFTIVGDTFSLSERTKVQSWLGSVWGIASLAGPFLGGFLIDSLSWHWIFYINIPFGILSLILLQKNMTEKFEKRKHKIDYAGILVLSAAIVSLLYGVMAAGGNTLKLLASIFVTLILLALLYFIEKKAAEPAIPFSVFTKTSNTANFLGFMTSAVMVGIGVYLPIYLQNVLDFSATVSGLAIFPQSLTWMLTSVILTRYLPRFGEKVIVASASFILAVSCALMMSTLGIASALILIIIYAALSGFGFGGSFNTLTIVIQESVDYSKRGAAVGVNTLIRTLGQTIGISIFGSVFNSGIVNYFNKLGIKGIDPDSLYTAEGAAKGITIDHVHQSINASIHTIFIITLAITAVCLVAALLLPSKLKAGNKEAEEGSGEII